MGNKILTNNNGDWTPHGSKNANIDLTSIASILDYSQRSATWKSYSNYSIAAHESMIVNVISGRAIQYISQAIGTLELVVSQNGEPLKTHPLLTLLARPNPQQGKSIFLQTAMIHKLIAGTMYIRAIRHNGRAPSELELLRPDRVLVNESGNSRIPTSYTYQDKSFSQTFQVNPVTGVSDEILPIAYPHPLEDHQGLSPTQQAARMICLHNSYTEFAKKQLENGANISGMIVAKDDLNDDSREHLKSEFEKSYTGVKNAGKPLFATGDITWESMGQSNRDLAYMEGLLRAAIDIATAYGLPPNLVGIQEASTFGNMAEMRLDAWEGCILPLADTIMDELNNWLTPMYGDNLELSYDKDQISALTIKKQQKVDTLLKLRGILTNEEIRLELGYPPLKEEQEQPAPEEEQGPVDVDEEEPVEEEPVDVEEEADEPKQMNMLNLKATDMAEDHIHEIDPSIKSGQTTPSPIDGHTHSYTIGAKHTGITDGHRHTISGIEQ